MGEKVDTARLRGSLERSADARLIESAARSACRRLSVIASAGTNPSRVIAKAYGPDAPTGRKSKISPFARAIGVAFEGWLFNDDASALRDVYETTAGWRPEGVVDLRALHKGDQEEAAIRTAELVEHRIATGEGPEIILGARFNLSTASGETHVHPDLLVARPGWRRYRVADVKSYLDLDGRTDPTEIATAVRQIAVGIAAIRQSSGDSAADDDVDIVLRVPRHPGAGVRTLDASVEIATITTWFAGTGVVASRALAETGGQALDSRAAVESIPHQWDASCEGHCPMSAVCHAEAVDRDDLMLLGPVVRSTLEGIPTISRATALAAGEDPTTPDEARIAASLAAGWQASMGVEAEYSEAGLS